MKRLFMLIFALIVLALVSSSFAHSGRTDSNGGHRSGNSYHYHHGYPAHQHTDGICPYDFDDQTNRNGNGNGGSGSSRDFNSAVISPSPSPSPEPSPSPILPVENHAVQDDNKPTEWWKLFIEIIFIGLMVIFFGLPLLSAVVFLFFFPLLKDILNLIKFLIKKICKRI